MENQNIPPEEFTPAQRIIVGLLIIISSLIVADIIDRTGFEIGGFIAFWGIIIGISFLGFF